MNNPLFSMVESLSFANGNITDLSLSNCAHSITPNSQDLDDPFWANLVHMTLVSNDLSFCTTLTNRSGQSYLAYLREYSADELAFDYLKPFVGLPRLKPVVITLKGTRYLAYRRYTNDVIDVMQYSQGCSITRNDTTYTFISNVTPYADDIPSLPIWVLTTLTRQLCDPLVAKQVMPLVQDLAQRLLNEEPIPTPFGMP